MFGASFFRWVLVEAVLPPHIRRRPLVLRAHRQDATECEDIVLFSGANGRIHELLRLPSGVTGFRPTLPPGTRESDLAISVRDVGLMARWREIFRRCNRIRAQLSKERRLALGLRTWQMLIAPGKTYRRIADLGRPLTYTEWVDSEERSTCGGRKASRETRASDADTTHFHFVIFAGADQPALLKTLRSIAAQTGRLHACSVLLFGASSEISAIAGSSLELPLQIEVVPASEAGARLNDFNTTLANHPDDWLFVLQPGSVLPQRALNQFASAIESCPGAAAFYSDDDALATDGRRVAPRFKPDWSLTYLRSVDYVGDAVTLRAGDVASAGGVTRECVRYGNFDLLLRIADALGAEQSTKIRHLPAVLLHRAQEEIAPRGIHDSPVAVREWAHHALAAHLLRNGVHAEVSEDGAPGRRISYALSNPQPLVSIIVPTRDAPALIRQCVESVLGRSSYPNIELLVIDNQSVDPEALAYLSTISNREEVRVLRYDHPFNYSAINNFAVQQARGDVICLLNDDTEVITPGWIEEMLGQLQQSNVGVVGAKLLYPNGTIQHGGILLGVGDVAIHAHAFLDREDPGYMGRAMLAQDLSAVTGACLMVRRSLYLDLGGLNEDDFPVAFNDVDFCLRARARDWRVVWTPFAELYHHESESRRKQPSRSRIRGNQRAAAILRRQWAGVLQRDPFYNPNLSFLWPDFGLGHTPGSPCDS